MMKTEERKSIFLKYLEKTKGIVADAVKLWASEDSLNVIERTTHYLWMKTDPEYKKDVEELQRYTFEFVESKMYELVENGSERMIQLYMNLKANSTIGREKGFVKSIDQNIKGDTNINISFKEPEESEDEKEDEDE